MAHTDTESESESLSVTRAKRQAVSSICMSRNTRERLPRGTPPGHRPRLHHDDHHHHDEHGMQDTQGASATPPKSLPRKRRIVLVGKKAAAILRAHKRAKQQQHEHEHQQQPQSLPAEADSHDHAEHHHDSPPRAHPPLQAPRARPALRPAAGQQQHSKAGQHAKSTPVDRKMRRPKSPERPPKSSTCRMQMQAQQAQDMTSGMSSGKSSMTEGKTSTMGKGKNGMTEGKTSTGKNGMTEGKASTGKSGMMDGKTSSQRQGSNNKGKPMMMGKGGMKDGKTMMISKGGMMDGKTSKTGKGGMTDGKTSTQSQGCPIGQAPWMTGSGTSAKGVTFGKDGAIMMMKGMNMMKGGMPHHLQHPWLQLQQQHQEQQHHQHSALQMVMEGLGQLMGQHHHDNNHYDNYAPRQLYPHGFFPGRAP